MSYRSIKSRVMDEADEYLLPYGFSVWDMPDFLWGDYDDGREALIEALYYWMDYGDIPSDIAEMILDDLE